MNNPDSLKYTQTHQWVNVENSGEVTVGITDYAQDQLGDIVYAELPETGQRYAANEECMVIESVKAASDIYMPISGEIAAVNGALVEQPELINDDPFGAGWLFRIYPDNIKDIDGLLSANEYEALLDE